MQENVSRLSSLRDLWRLQITEVAGPFNPARETRESWRAKAARATGLSAKQLSRLWYGDYVDEFSRPALILGRAAAAAESARRAKTQQQAQAYERIADALNNIEDSERRDRLLDLARTLRGMDEA